MRRTSYFRSVATRGSKTEVPEYLADIIAATKAAGFDMVIVETPGIGQGDGAIVDLVDVSLYVMTPEFGAASQLEKIDMLDYADCVAINKMDRKGALDAVRDVRKQVQRNREAFGTPTDQMPVFGCMASKFADPGVTALYQELLKVFAEKGFNAPACSIDTVTTRISEPGQTIVPPERSRYLAEISETVRGYHKIIETQSTLARERQQLRESKRMLEGAGAKAPDALNALIEQRDEAMDPRAKKLIEIWPRVVESYSGDEYVVKIRDKEVRYNLKRSTLSGNRISRVALPKYADEGELLKFLLKENLPGSFPYTAGVFSPSNARARTRPGCSRARAIRSAPTNASSSCPAIQTPSACRPHSTASRFTVSIRMNGPTFTARSATPASPSRRSTT